MACGRGKLKLTALGITGTANATLAVQVKNNQPHGTERPTRTVNPESAMPSSSDSISR